MKQFVCCVMIFILGLGVLSACSQTSGATGGEKSSEGMVIKDPWARPGQPGDNTAVYFVIENESEEADTLLNASCDFAEACELHLSEMDASGTMKMTHQTKVPVPKNQSVAFKPGGLHVIVMKITKALKVGDTFIVMLNFEKAGAVKVEAPVREQQE